MTVNATVATNVSTKQSATPRSARRSALLPGIGKRSRRCSIWTPSESAPANVRSDTLSGSRSGSAGPGGVGGGVEAGRDLARRQRPAAAGEVVAGRAVEPEQLAALGQVAVAQVATRDGRPTADGLHVGPDLLGLRERVLRRLALSLRLLP